MSQDAAVGRGQRPHCQRQRQDQAHTRAIGPDAQRPSGQATLKLIQEGIREQREVEHFCCSAMKPCKLDPASLQQGVKHRKTEGFILNDFKMERNYFQVLGSTVFCHYGEKGENAG